MTDPVRDPIPILARRAARIAASVVLVIGVAALVVATWQCAHDPYGYRHATRLHALPVLGITWATALIVAAAVHGAVRVLRPAWRRERLFVASWMLPAVALAFILPITLHALVAVACRASELGFDDWVRYSAVITGVAHAVFASLCALRVHRLLTDRVAMSPQRILVFTVATSCVPFVLLLGIPPLLVAVTGLPLLPLLRRLEPWIDRERDELAAMPQRLPRAALVVRRAA